MLLAMYYEPKWIPRWFFSFTVEQSYITEKITLHIQFCDQVITIYHQSVFIGDYFSEKRCLACIITLAKTIYVNSLTKSSRIFCLMRMLLTWELPTHSLPDNFVKICRWCKKQRLLMFWTWIFKCVCFTVFSIHPHY